MHLAMWDNDQMSSIERILENFESSSRLIQETAESLSAPISQAADQIVHCLMSDGKVLACGNGGSAATTQKWVSEMVNRFERERPGLAAIALTTNTSILTAIANDYAYNQVFSRQVSALGQPGDLLLAISTSGNSESVVRAAEAAREREMSVIVLTGQDGGNLAEQMSDRDILICVPADNTARIQEIHLLIIHCLCDVVDSVLLGVA
jgi:D-sedoheptulose 7-phosphate isomerase